MKIAFGIVLYNSRPKDFDALMKSIIFQEDSQDCSKLILLKSNDGKACRSLVDSFKDRNPDLECDFTVLDRVDNCGFGAGHNLLISKAHDLECDVYIGCNPDGRLHPLALGRFMLEFGNRKKETLYEFRQFPQEHPKTYDHFKGKTRWVSGACFAARVDFLKKLNGFDENIDMYCEDVDLSWRVLAEGGECIILPQCLFYHDMSDQRARQSVRLEMLRAGRYLAWKWKSQGFQDIMEEELVKLRLGDEKSTLPPLPPGQRVPYSDAVITQVAEFRRLFSFSPTRW